jgi:hypothetical protein
LKIINSILTDLVIILYTSTEFKLTYAMSYLWLLEVDSLLGNFIARIYFKSSCARQFWTCIVKSHLCINYIDFICSFSFDHCIALPSSSYCFCIPLCYLESFPTFILLLVIDVKNVLNYPPFKCISLTSYYCSDNWLFFFHANISLIQVNLCHVLFVVTWGRLVTC